MREDIRPVIHSFTGQHAFLSNFYPIAKDGTTIEHLYQFYKCSDPDEADKVLWAATPGRAKRLGRQAKIKPWWNEIRIDVMRSLLGFKFSSCFPELRQKLLDTGDAILVEGNHWGDQFWGMCEKTSDNFTVPCIVLDSGRVLQGYNHLGRLLMEVRLKLYNASVKPPGPPGGPEIKEVVNLYGPTI